MMQKRTTYSLLLTCLILVFAVSSSFSQDVSFESKTVLRCQASTMNVTVNNPNDISALELVFTVPFASFSVSWDPAFVAPVLSERSIEVVGNTVRMYAYGGDCLTAGGQNVVAQIDFITDDVCEGEFDIEGADKACPAPSTVVATTQFVDCVTAALVPVVVNTGTITVSNAAPSITAIPDADVAWTANFNYSATATDNDLGAVPGGCEALIFKKVSGPAGLAVSNGGAISWSPTGADICGDHVVEVEVVDGCEAADTTSFTICVFNIEPAIDSVTGDFDVLAGETVTGQVFATDPDAGPGPLAYTEVSFDGPGDLIVNADGTFSWDVEITLDNSFVGTWTACMAVNDAAAICDPCSPNNADTVCIEITVNYFQVVIEKVHDAIQGSIHPVSIDAYFSIGIGGYDLLIEYDASAMSVNSVLPGSYIDPNGCAWEYFTYRYGPNGNCGPNACPNGKLRIVAIAETNNGDNHPEECGASDGMEQLAVINFLVSNDRTLECQYAAIRFCWYDCVDNSLSSITGDTLLISRNVWDYSWADSDGNPIPVGEWIQIDVDGVGYPTRGGAQDADCFVGDPEKFPLRNVDFRNGGIDIVCADSIDGRGDVNLNEIAYEVADAVLFSNYFVYGIAAFDNTNVDGKIAATDVNADGIVLSVADLVYLIRVVVGDAAPYPKSVVPVNASYVQMGNGVMSVNDNVEMGAAFVVFEGNVAPELKAMNMDMRYNYDGANTRVLVYSIDGNSFTGAFLQSTANVVSIEMATADGSPVTAKLLPTEFALAQNYPNPFNPTTTLGFSLPFASQYDLTIYNVSGQQVARYSGSAEAGNHTIDWNASNLASGVYLYKLTADGRQIDTKKMVLLK